MFNNFFADLRFAARTLAKSPGFTAVAVITLALGIGANTAIFSVMSAVLIEDLPYDEPDRVVRVLEYQREQGMDRGTTSLPNALDLRDGTGAIEKLAAYDEWQPTLTETGEPQRLDAASVTADYFDVLGVRAHLGRFFLPAEDEPGVAQSVVLSHGYWQRQLGGDPSVIGDALTLSGIPYTVVGVAPPEFEDPRLSGSAFDEPVLWRVSPGYFANAERGGFSFTAVARLRGDVSLSTAQAQADAAMAALENEYPDTNASRTFLLVPLKEQITAAARQPLLIFLGAVGLVLLIACANVAALLLSRNSERDRELSVRGALGATRARLVGQLLTESVLIASLGGVLGIGLAYGATDLIAALHIEDLPRSERIEVDLGVLAFAAFITLATAVVFGLAPALHAAARRLPVGLAEGGRGNTGGPGRRRAFKMLVGIEVALALVLLMGAGLLARSFWHLQNVDPGVATSGILTLELDPPFQTYGQDPATLSVLYDELSRRLAEIPGVDAFGTVNILPFSGRFNGFRFWRAGRPEPADGAKPSAEARSVTPGYFDALGIALIRGRALAESDRADAPPVIVVNRSMAARIWPDEDAIGKRIMLRDQACEVVGIVGNVHQFSLREPPEPTMYLPQEQAPGWMRRDLKLVLRTRAEPAALEAPVRAAVRAVDPSIPVSNVITMEQAVSATLQRPRFQAALLALFAAVALILGTTGIYSVVAYGVTRRTPELGIRQALGARPGALTWHVVRDGMAPVVTGSVIGIVAALFLGQLISGVLFGVGAGDPATLAGVTATLLGAALLASYLPARRAARIQPTEALRHE